MEVAGFAIGTITAVGLIGQLFDGCVKAYAFFTSAKNLGRDSERLVCKIRIEEARLMAWGREWGVVEGKLEAHLASGKGHNEGLKQLAASILKQLHETITDFNKLQDRYGLREDPTDADEKGSVRSPEPSTSSRLRDGLKLRARWVISDRDKFGVLLVDLKDFNDGLERLFPPSRIASFQRTWTNELLQTASRDIDQLNLLETASNGVYPQLNTFASLKQLRINLDERALQPTKFKASTTLKIPKHLLNFSEGGGKRVTAEYQKNHDESSPQPVIIEWIDYEEGLDLDARLVLYQRVDNLARMVHSASNRHPDLHTLDCVGYFDDSQHTRYGLIYKTPPNCTNEPLTLSSLILDSSVATPDLGDRFRLAHTLSIALWSFHSLDWLHKTFCSENVLFFHGSKNLGYPYVTGFDSSRPDHLDEMTVASNNDIGQDLYRHPDSLGVWRQSYRKSFDIYSLGLVLLEIGLWKSLKNFHKPKYTPTVFREKVMQSLVPGLGHKTGALYRDVVMACLQSEEVVTSDGAGKLMEWVVLTLEGLRV
ncbi:MAG: hypothetical protein M1813_004349 [Trichoglossum hirsutum]|nr:MAG: hypothetical protein M1813_004349 [Trichoglossum hirsutum]